ncbi:unnamed protein product [Closterium sp. NIES-54]
MDVARTSMIHAAAPHFLWPFAVQYAAHQINLQPRVSLPKTSPTLRWTGKVGDASAFRIWGSRAFVRDLFADKLSSRAVPCVFLGFPPDAPGRQFYHPTSRRVLFSQDVTFDESVPYYRLFPYRTAPLPPPPLFLVPGPPPVDPLPPQGPAPSGVSQVDAVEPVEVAADSGASGGAEPERAEPGGAESGGAEPERAESGAAELGGAELGGDGSRGAEPARAEPGGAASVSWRSTRSSSVLSSSCEAEIYAGAMAAQELRWLTYLLADLGELPRSPPVLYVDNKAMLALCREHRLEHRTKHIALRFFLAHGQLRLAYVASQANTADIFTKALQPCAFAWGSEGLGFESQCVHFGHPSAGGCQRSTGDPRLIIGKGYRHVGLGSYRRTDPLLNKPFYPNEWSRVQIPAHVRLGGYGCTLTRYLTSPSIPMARSPGGLWAHSDPLLNKPFYPNGLVVGILTCTPAINAAIRKASSSPLPNSTIDFWPFFWPSRCSFRNSAASCFMLW